MTRITVPGSVMARVRRSSLHSTANSYFEAVARLGSVRKAASELFVVPSAVSHQISALEAELGLPLFIRLPRGVKLTSAGETLLYHMRRSAAEVERGRSFLQGLTGLKHGFTSLATVEGVAVGPVADVLDKFWKKWPLLNVSVTVGSSTKAFQSVDAGDAELGLAYAAADEMRVNIIARADLRLGAIFRGDHPLAKKRQLRLQDLTEAGLPLLLADRSIEIRQMVEHALGNDAMRLLPRLNTNSVLLMSTMARRGMGAAIKTRVAIEDELKNGELVFVRLKELEKRMQTLVLFARLDTPLTPAASALATVLAQRVVALHEH